MDKNVVYIDANLFISAATEKNKRGENARAIIQNIENGKYRAITSTLTIDEVLWVIEKIKDRETAVEVARLINEMPNLELIVVDRETIQKMLELYEKNMIRPRDAIHLATMLIKDINKIISTDKDFDGIKEINRIDFSK